MKKIDIFHLTFRKHGRYASKHTIEKKHMFNAYEHEDHILVSFWHYYTGSENFGQRTISCHAVRWGSFDKKLLDSKEPILISYCEKSRKDVINRIANDKKWNERNATSTLQEAVEAVSKMNGSGTAPHSVNF